MFVLSESISEHKRVEELALDVLDDLLREQFWSHRLIDDRDKVKVAIVSTVDPLRLWRGHLHADDVALWVVEGTNLRDEDLDLKVVVLCANLAICIESPLDCVNGACDHLGPVTLVLGVSVAEDAHVLVVIEKPADDTDISNVAALAEGLEVGDACESLS